MLLKISYTKEKGVLSMAKLLNKMLNLVGWELEEEETEEENSANKNDKTEDYEQPQIYNPISSYRRQNPKVVNMHTSSQIKLVVVQPSVFDDAQSICDHLKNKKPVIVNLENMEKDVAQRVIDFLCGSVYIIDGHIQKVSNGIFVVAPNNVDISGDLSEEFKNKTFFSWVK